MKKTVTCIICPRGCSMEVDISGEDIVVKGNSCPKGEKYAIDECTNPMRTVTSIVRVSNREDTMVSVKTSEPVSKKHIFDVMQSIRNSSVEAPVRIGDEILDGVYGSKIVATKDID